jgi:hypothetical protein
VHGIVLLFRPASRLDGVQVVVTILQCQRGKANKKLQLIFMVDKPLMSVCHNSS